jgi:hypothetical protein
MLAGLLPGVRELRAPLAAGYLWLLLGWLILEATLVSADAKGTFEPFTKLAPVAKGFGITVVVSFAAYLLGSLAVSAIPRIPRPRRRTIRAPGSMSEDGWASLKLWAEDAIQGVLARIRAESPRGADALLRLVRPDTFDPDVLAGAIATNDFPLIKTQLLANAEKLHSEVDRKESEAGFRFAIVPPLLGLVTYATATGSLVWMAAGIPVLALLYQGWEFEREAADTLVTALRATSDIEAPAVLLVEYRLRQALPDVVPHSAPSSIGEYPEAIVALSHRIEGWDASLFGDVPRPLRTDARSRLAEVEAKVRPYLEERAHDEVFAPLSSLGSLQHDLDVGQTQSRYWQDIARDLAAVAEALERLLRDIGPLEEESVAQLPPPDPGQMAERFSRAVDQFGAAEANVRLGGIYALEGIARDSLEHHPQVIEMLTAYVRERARWRPDDNEPPHSTPELPTDVQAAMSVLARRDTSRDREGARLDLARTDLRGLEADRARLAGVRLVEAHLDTARLMEADLRDANLRNASLRRANLRRADLSGARLDDAQLGGTDFDDARLDGASFRSAHFTAETRWPHDFDSQAEGAIETPE